MPLPVQGLFSLILEKNKHVEKVVCSVATTKWCTDRFHMTEKNMEIFVTFHRLVVFTIYQILKHVCSMKKGNRKDLDHTIAKMVSTLKYYFFQNIGSDP